MIAKRRAVVLITPRSSVVITYRSFVHMCGIFDPPAASCSCGRPRLRHNSSRPAAMFPPFPPWPHAPRGRRRPMRRCALRRGPKAVPSTVRVSCTATTSTTAVTIRAPSAYGRQRAPSWRLTTLVADRRRGTVVRRHRRRHGSPRTVAAAGGRHGRENAEIQVRPVAPSVSGVTDAHLSGDRLVRLLFGLRVGTIMWQKKKLMFSSIFFNK